MDDVVELEKICQKIIKLNVKMRSARFINSRGHLIAGGMMFMELALRVKMRHEFDAEFGKVHFSISYRDKVIVMSFPLPNDDVLLVSSEKNVDFSKLAFRILTLIESLKKTPSKTF